MNNILSLLLWYWSYIFLCEGWQWLALRTSIGTYWKGSSQLWLFFPFPPEFCLKSSQKAYLPHHSREQEWRLESVHTDVKLKSASSFLPQAARVDRRRAAEPEHVPPSWRRPLWGESVTTDSYVIFHVLCRCCVTLPTVGLNYFPNGNSWFTGQQIPRLLFFLLLLLRFDANLLLTPSLPLQCKLPDAP